VFHRMSAEYKRLTKTKQDREDKNNKEKIFIMLKKLQYFLEHGAPQGHDIGLVTQHIVDVVGKFSARLQLDFS
jgi:hypothetical protein